MCPAPDTWIKDFLGKRRLERPDGRALYAYRCTAEEFDSLTELLRCTPFDIAAAPRHRVNVQVRAFVLYAAEWWQRRYDGGPWSWEPLLESVQCRHVYYPDLYEPVRSALRWWEVDLVRLPTSVRYLGTFACQGGLPLGLVGDADSRVAYYLRAVLNHAIEYRKFVNDSIDLARDQQHLLHPPTLRRDYVFRLVADLIEAVLALRDDAQGKDPITTLDQVCQGWRKTMPLSLENERARNILTSLLREAVQDRPPAGDFRVERFLRKTSVGWRLGARFRLPASIPAEHLACHLEVSKDDLPPKMAVRVYGDRVHDVGVYEVQSDNFVLMDLKKQSRTELWDAEAAAEIRLQFVSGGVVGEGVYPYRGAALGELPWAFRGDISECPFIGEGSVSNRAPEIFVLAPDGCTTVFEESSESESETSDSSTEVKIPVLNRALWIITERTEIVMPYGRCVVKPSSDQMVEEYYCLQGQRYYDLESAHPLFLGEPRLRVAKIGQAPLSVSAKEVTWRQTGKEWQQSPDSFGLWEVRHVHGGEIRYLGRVGILPENFRLSLEPGADISEGYLKLHGLENIKISSSDQDVLVELKNDNIREGMFRIRVSVKDTYPPAYVRLNLHSRGPTALAVQAPFPGRGGRFLRNGKPLDQKLAVDDLYGVHAIALSPKDTEHFWLDGELKSPDMDKNMLGATYFRHSFRKSTLLYELPLFEVRPLIEQLLAASSSSEARVELRITSSVKGMPKPHDPECTQVRRFSGILEKDCSKSLISISSSDLKNNQNVTFEIIPITQPNSDTIPLKVINFSDMPPAAKLTRDLSKDEPYMVVARHEGQVHIRPILISAKSSKFDDSFSERNPEPPQLCEALRLHDWDLRKRALVESMDAMLYAEDTPRVEEEWSFLTDSLLCAEDMPVTELDILKVLVTNPKLLVRCIFRMESTSRQLLWRLEDELPFSWLLINREIWLTEARYACEYFRAQLADVSDGNKIARDHIVSILSEASDQIPALRTVACDIQFQLMRDSLIPDQIIKDTHNKRDKKTQKVLNFFAKMEKWPKGDGRREWAKNLEHGDLLEEINMWQPAGGVPERQPIFDTPVAAAWCCFKSQATDRTTFLVKRIRAHDPEWFDVAYEAAWFKFAIMQDKGEL